MEMKEPIYKVIERDLRKDILNGTLKQGDMIPSEIELCAKYGVARMTVRHAVDNLLIDGYIYRHKGRGTFVVFNKQEMDQNKQVPFFSFSREMIAGNGKLINTVINFSIEEPDEIIAKKLQLLPSDKVYYVERIRKSENVALVYERIYLPVNLFPELKEEDFLHSIHDYVENKMCYSIRNCECAIEARALAAKVAKILNCTENESALYMSSVTYLDNGRAFMYNRQYFLGTHFRFKHNFTKK
jgi:GntR family transcriptional regulator